MPGFANLGALGARLLAVVPAILAHAVTIATVALAETPTYEAFNERVIALRAEGKFAEALEECLRFDERLRSMKGVPEHRRGDVRRTIETLRYVVSRPSAEQRDIAVADSLTPSLFQHYGEESYAAGNAVAERQLSIRHSILGPRHVETLESLAMLTLMLDGLGRTDTLAQMMQSVVDGNRQSLEPDHPAIEFSLNNLAALLDERGRLADAEPVYRECLALARTRAMEDPVSLATTLSNLGTNLHDQGKFPEGEKYLREAWHLFRQAHADPADVARVENNSSAIVATSTGRSFGYAEPWRSIRQRTIPAGRWLSRTSELQTMG
jgi:tetratricopeptide (TPR) repeat protein